MKHLDVKFIKGVVARDGVPSLKKKQIALLGRSNVGKSSFLNSLTQRKSLARSSKRPGKTTELNFFQVANSYYLVDLPGYGFAKQPQGLREQIEEMIEWYITDPVLPIAKFLLLIDCKVGPTEDDHMLCDLLLEHHPDELVIIGSKSDKVKRGEHHKLKRDLMMFANGAPVFLTSSKTGEGIGDIRHNIFGGNSTVKADSQVPKS